MEASCEIDNASEVSPPVVALLETWISAGLFVSAALTPIVAALLPVKKLLPVPPVELYPPFWIVLTAVMTFEASESMLFCIVASVPSRASMAPWIEPPLSVRSAPPAGLHQHLPVAGSISLQRVAHIVAGHERLATDAHIHRAIRIGAGGDARDL